MNGVKDMMGGVAEKVNKPKREELEANIKISQNWITAVKAGNFPGAFAMDIGMLLGFLANQNELAKKDYEAMFPPAEWGKKPATGVAHE